MITKTVTCPICHSDASVYDIDEETASDQGNGKPKLECFNEQCRLMVQTESVDDLRRVVMGKM